MRKILDRIERGSPFVLLILMLAMMFVQDEAAEPRSTVKGRLQTRPGGPLEVVDARVEPAPRGVTVVAADDAGLDDDELVLGVVVGGNARAYPIRYLSRNEVVGDRIGDVAIAATWCPLTASAVAFRRELDGRELTFDFVWGLVHDNLVIADRETGSVWSQLAGKALDGPLKDSTLPMIPSLQTTWAFWKSRHASTDVGIVPDVAGPPYFYFDAGDGDIMQAMAGREHDVSSLGLGLEVGSIEAFFPLHVLENGSRPLRIDIGGTLVVVHHDRDGMTAWAEDPDGEPLRGVLVYRKAWTAFHPHTRVWGSQPDCGPRE